MLYIRKAEERGHADHGWLDTRHTFSFADLAEDVPLFFLLDSLPDAVNLCMLNIRTGRRCLLSGYTDWMNDRITENDQKLKFISKPFTFKDLFVSVNMSLYTKSRKR
jgi:hypothetical protein